LDDEADLMWYQLVALAKRCHQQAQSSLGKVTTTIRIRDQSCVT
jgi:hypothetical protein